MATNEVYPIQATGAAIELVRATRVATSPAAENGGHSIAANSAPLDEQVRQGEDPVVKQIRSDMVDPNVRVGFFMVEGSSQPVIRIYNKQTGEVVRQIPDDAVLHLRERFAEMLGVMADKKA